MREVNGWMVGTTDARFTGTVWHTVTDVREGRLIAKHFETEEDAVAWAMAN